MTPMNLYMKHKQSHGHREQTACCQQGEGWGKDAVGDSGRRCKVLNI